MTLEHGSRLGNYELGARIGAGGMGEVYRARDLSLERDVAIKVLTQDSEGDRDRVRRFEREAKALAALNHPNVATIHGFEVDGPMAFLVMELVEGEDLAERLRRGALPCDEAIPLFVQVAEGLEAAHSQGIVHRDLKPANIKIAPGGRAKILDFGLAKQRVAAAARGSDNLQNSPTLTAATGVGEILGTAAYLSPEQARGEPSDSRADIWSFGVTLYEGLVGARPFSGTSATDLIAAVLRDTPDLDQLPSETPRSVRRLLKRCLVKDRRDRLGDMTTARLELLELEEPVQTASDSPRRPRWLPLALVVGSLLLGVLGGWWLALQGRADLVHPEQRHYALKLPPDRPLVRASYQWGNSTVRLSPDGRWLVYLSPGSASQTSAGTLFKRRLDQDQWERVGTSASVSHPFFSHDSEWLVYASDDGANGELIRVPVDGGQPTVIAELQIPVVFQMQGGAWCDDGYIYVGLIERGLHRLAASGGELEPVGEFARDGIASYPNCLPGSKALIVTRNGAMALEERYLDLVDPETGSSRTLLEEAESARYLPSGHLVFARAGALTAVPFSLRALEITGPEQNVTPTGMQSRPIPYQWAVTDSGTLIYSDSPVVTGVLLPTLVDQNGVAESLGLPPLENGRFASLSRDGRFVGSSITGPLGEANLIWRSLSAGAGLRQIPAGEGILPVWSPDGETIVYASAEPGATMNLYSVPRDGSEEPRRLTVSPFGQYPAEIMADGKTLIFSERRDTTGHDVFALDLDDPPPISEKTPVLTGDDEEFFGSFSPDGERFVYRVRGLSDSKIFVREWNGGAPGPENLVAQGDFGMPTWGQTDDEIYVTSADGIQVIRADSASAGESWSLPERVVEIETDQFTLDVTPDGERFLVLRPDQGEQSTELRVIVNWTGELQRLLPQ